MSRRISLRFAVSTVAMLLFAAPTLADLPFSFSMASENGAIPDDDIAVFLLTMDAAHSDLAPAPPFPMPAITSLEVVVTGLVHSDADDLDIYLIDPLGHTLNLMTDRGVGSAINASLIFNDSASGLPPENGPIASGAYQPEGAGGLSKYYGNGGGTSAWILLVIDDSPGGEGSLQGFTLRGTYVPEPVTLSLLALGAVAVLRRRHA